MATVQERLLVNIYDWEALPSGLFTTTILQNKNKLYFTNFSALGIDTVFFVVGDASTALEDLPKHAYTSEQSQTFLGQKIFSSFPLLPNSDPSQDYQGAHKYYVDKRAGINYIESTDTSPIAYEIIGLIPATVIQLNHDVAEINLTEGLGSTPGHRVEVFNESAITTTVTDSIISYEISAGQSAIFFFLAGSLEQYVASGGGGGGAKEIGDLFYSAVPAEQSGCKYADYQLLSQIVYAELFGKIGHLYAKTSSDATSAESAGFFRIPDAQTLFARSGKSWSITNIEINISTDRITLSNHGFTTLTNGRPIKLLLKTGTLPVATGYTQYDQNYIRYVDANTIELYDTEAHAIDIASTTGRLDWTNAGSGTFLLTTMGCYQDHSLEEHEHNIFAQQSNGGAGALGLLSTASAGTTEYTYESVVTVKNANASNETRPSYIALGMQIKVISTSVSTGEPYDMLVYDTGWFTPVGWTNAVTTITHNLGVDATGLLIEGWNKSDNLGEQNQLLGYQDYGSHGACITSNDLNSLNLKISANGLFQMKADGTYAILHTQVNPKCRLVIYKPNLTAVTVPVGSVTYKYNTGWIQNSDWTNAEFTVNHNLSSNLSDLIVKFFISTDGTEANSSELQNPSYSSPSVLIYGVANYNINENSFKVQTGLSGIVHILSGSGSAQAINTQAYYYKVVCYKLDSIIV